MFSDKVRGTALGSRSRALLSPSHSSMPFVFVGVGEDFFQVGVSASADAILGRAGGLPSPLTESDLVCGGTTSPTSIAGDQIRTGRVGDPWV